MRITEFNGSLWGEQGHTHVMVQEFLAAAHQAGAKVQSCHLVKYQLKPCVKCGTCFCKMPGRCAVKDDMPGLIKKFMGSDFVIFATPVYIDNVTGLLKIFVERLLPVLEPHYEKAPDGEYRRRARFAKYPRFIIIASCAMPGQSNFQVIELFFRRMARTFRTEIAGEIYCSAAGPLLLSRQDVRFKALVDNYKALLRQAGREFVKTGTINGELAGMLRQPLLPADEYVEYANKTWDQVLKADKTKEFAHRMHVRLRTH